MKAKHLSVVGDPMTVLYVVTVYILYIIKPSAFDIIIWNICALVRKDIDVNIYESLSNLTLKHRLK
jgi:hypothetical protein